MPDQPDRAPIIVPPGGGRAYPMGRMQAVFKADLAETANACSISEWWLEPRTIGPNVHAHAEDHVFYVLAGVVSLSLAGVWSDAVAGTYVLIPGGTPHTFENRSDARAGFMSINTPGGFETRMPDIALDLAATDLRMDVDAP